MVDVRMGQYDCVDGFRSAFERQVVALLDILGPLIETTVDIDTKTTVFK